MKVDPLLNPFAVWWQFFWRVVRYIVALGAMATITAILYFYGPYRKQRWADVWPGAILATILWLLATLGFAWYIRNVTNYNVLYGSVGASIALLSWMYLLAAIALFGCEFNAELERTSLVTASRRAKPAARHLPPDRLVPASLLLCCTIELQLSCSYAADFRDHAARGCRSRAGDRYRHRLPEKIGRLDLLSTVYHALAAAVIACFIGGLGFHENRPSATTPTKAGLLLVSAVFVLSHGHLDEPPRQAG